MAHNITERDGLFTVREPAWHGLGKVFEDYPTREEAQAVAHPWEPITEPLYRRKIEYKTTQTKDSEPDPDEPFTVVSEATIEPIVTYEEVEESVGVQRSDNGEFLGVVGKGYGVVKNAEMYDIAEAIEGEAKHSVRFETGGSLKGGRKVWLLLRLNEPLLLGGRKGTETIPYFGLQNANDGSGSFRGQATMTRIVCDNTAHMADLDAQARGTEFTFRHSKNVGERIEDAKEAQAGWRSSVQEYRLMMEHLIDVRVTESQVSEFIERFIPMPPPHMISERVVTNVHEARGKLLTCFTGPTTEGVEMTAYGLTQAAIEYHEHYRKARSDETRFKRAYLDRATIVRDALDLAREVAHA